MIILYIVIVSSKNAGNIKGNKINVNVISG